jgi:cytochrome c peroxidase
MPRAASAARALCAVVVLSIGFCGPQAAAGDPYGHRRAGYGPDHPYPPAERNPGWRPENLLVSLGQKLFFDARLSGSGRTACASCHHPDYGYAEPRRVSLSDNGQLGRRNAPSVLDVRYYPALMWDGRFRALEQQAFGPFQSGEMGIGIDHAAHRLNSDPEYVDLFQAALGDGPTPDGMARALAAFQRTLVSRDSRVDRFLANNQAGILTPAERHGFEIFTRRAPCSNCHQVFPGRGEGGRALWTDFQYHNLGIGFRSRGFADTGRYERSPNPALWGAFRTPSLRNSARTPPYMHDGSLATLEEVVEFYSAGGRPNPNQSPLIRPLNLNGHEKAALVAFLRALAE